MWEEILAGHAVKPGRSQMSHSPEDTTGTGTGTGALSRSDYHQLLVSERRRVALDALTGLESPVDLDDLAAMVVEREAEEHVHDEELRASAAVALHHIHLPMMDDFGVVEYDPETTRVETCPLSSSL